MSLLKSTTNILLPGIDGIPTVWAISYSSVYILITLYLIGKVVYAPNVDSQGLYEAVAFIPTVYVCLMLVPLLMLLFSGMMIGMIVLGNEANHVVSMILGTSILCGVYYTYSKVKCGKEHFTKKKDIKTIQTILPIVPSPPKVKQTTSISSFPAVVNTHYRIGDYIADLDDKDKVRLYSVILDELETNIQNLTRIPQIEKNYDLLIPYTINLLATLLKYYNLDTCIESDKFTVMVKDALPEAISLIRSNNGYTSNCLNGGMPYGPISPE